MVTVLSGAAASSLNWESSSLSRPIAAARQRGYRVDSGRRAGTDNIRPIAVIRVLNQTAAKPTFGPEILHRYN